MNLLLLRARLRRWLRQPMGAVAVAGLIAALVLTGIPRIEVHAHARGAVPHDTHAQAADHDVGEHAQEQHPEGETVVHAHAAQVAATALPAVVDVTPAAVMPVVAPTTQPLTIALPNRPTEFFRPPIA